MAAEFGHQQGQLGVVIGRDQGQGRLVGGQVGVQPLAPRRPALIGQGREQVVGRVLDPGLQGRAAGLGEGQALALGPLQRHHLPAGGLEDFAIAGEHAVRGGGVQALAVVVDDPPGVAHVVFAGLDQGLVDVALVQFGVAEQRDHPAHRLRIDRAARGQIVLGQRGEGGHRHAQADRAGREIDVVLVLGPRRIGLRPAQGAEALQLVQGLTPEQVLDGVEHRAGVRLDRHPVLRPQGPQIERRHQGGHRGAGGLVAADLQAVAAFAQVVGVVDGPRRQPENSFLQPPEGRNIVLANPDAPVSHDRPVVIRRANSPHRLRRAHTPRSASPSTPAIS